MGLDFSLDEQQLELRGGARQFADGVLSGVAAALADIPGPEARFYAIKHFYQQMVDAGFVQRTSYAQPDFSRIQRSAWGNRRTSAANTVRSAQSLRTWVGPAEHSDFVAQHEKLDVLRGGGASEQ